MNHFQIFCWFAVPVFAKGPKALADPSRQPSGGVGSQKVLALDDGRKQVFVLFKSGFLPYGSVYRIPPLHRRVFPGNGCFAYFESAPGSHV